VFSLCLSILSKIIEKGVDVFGITYENPMHKNFPLSYKIIKYYNCEVFRFEEVTNNVFEIFTEDSEQFSLKL
jgi:hypothetical protein